MARQALLPGVGYINETGARQALIPGGAYINETQGGSGFSAAIALVQPAQSIAISARSFSDALALTQGTQSIAISARSFSAAISLAQGAHTFAFAGKEHFSDAIVLRQGAQSISVSAATRAFVALSLTQPAQTISIGSHSFACTLALTQKINVFSLTDHLSFTGSLALAPGKALFVMPVKERFIATSALLTTKNSLAYHGHWQFQASLPLTQPENIVNIKVYHNSLVRWAPAGAGDTRDRTVAPSLQQTRETAATLTQTRSVSAGLQQSRTRPPSLGD